MLSDETTWSFRDRVLWLAGLLDGEGSFGLIINKEFYPNIRLGMTDRDTVERAARFMGIDLQRITTRKGENRPDGHTRKDAYYFTVSGSTAAGWLMILVPYLSARRTARTLKILERWRSRPIAHGDRRLCPRGHRYTIVKDWDRRLKEGRRRVCRTCNNAKRARIYLERMAEMRLGRRADTRTLALPL